MSDDTLEYMRLLRMDGPLFLQALPPLGGPGPFLLARDRGEVEAFRERWNGTYNLYCRPNVIIPGTGKRESLQDRVYVLFVDIDCYKPGEQALEEVKTLLRESHIPPTWAVMTGGGVQAYWMLDVPTDYRTACRINEFLIEHFRGDGGTYTPERNMRLPGTINIPNAAKLKVGRTRVLAHLLPDVGSGVVYNEIDFPQCDIPEEYQTVDLTLGDYAKDVDLNTLNLTESLVYLIEHGKDERESKHGDNSRYAFMATAALIRAGVPNEVIAGIMLDERFHISDSLREKGHDGADRAMRRSIVNATARGITPVERMSADEAAGHFDSLPEEPTADERLYEELAALEEGFFERAYDIARLKVRDIALWAKLWSLWHDKKVRQMGELGRRVDQIIRDSKTKAKKPSSRDSDFELDQNGAIMPNLANVTLAFEKMKVTLSYDSFLGQPVIDGLGEKFNGPMGDSALTRLWTNCESMYGFRPNINNLRLWASDIAFENSFHPVLDYLNGLSWDGVPRIDTWLTTYCGAEDTPYARAVGSIWLTAAVRRVREPGCKFDEMIILESAQGFNKSTLLNTLAVKDEWFSDSINFSASEKEVIEGSTGVWIAEYGELQGMHKSDVEKLKGHRSRRFDRARLAYGHLPTRHARQNVDAGTTNGGKASGYLMDGSGNRRFWPIEVKFCDVKGMLRDRDQIWAEAATREASGTSIRLDESLWPSAAVEQAKREVPNAFAEAISDVLGGMTGYITKTDAWELINIPIERREVHGRRFGEAWRKLGWKEHNWRMPDQTHVFAKGCSDQFDGRQIYVRRNPFSHKVECSYGPWPDNEI